MTARIPRLPYASLLFHFLSCLCAAWSVCTFYILKYFACTVRSIFSIFAILASLSLTPRVPRNLRKLLASYLRKLVASLLRKLLASLLRKLLASPPKSTVLEGCRSLREYHPSSNSSPQESFCMLRVTGNAQN